MSEISIIDEEKQDFIQTLMYITSGFSIIGCLFIMTNYIWKIYYKEKCDFTAKMIFVMSCIDLFDASFKLFGTTGYIRPILCNIQGFIMNSAGVSGVVWLSCMAFTWYRWIVRRDDELKLQTWFPYYCIISFIPSSIESIYLGIAGKYGKAGFYCWIADEYGDLRIYFFFTWVFASAFLILLFAILVCIDVSRRTKSQENHEAMQSSSIIFNKLTAYVCIFLIVWGPCIVNRLVQFGRHESIYELFVVHIIFNNSQGFLNAIVYGGVLGAARRALLGDDTSSKTRMSALSDLEHSFLEEDLPSVNISMFATTFNMGEGKPSLDMTEWIPLGHDIYVIGVQECLYVTELRNAIKSHLENGAKKSFVEYEREIGSKNTVLGYHGYIAIAVYVAQEEVDNKNFHMPTPSTSEVNCGKTLNFRTSNKGGVGFAFRYMDTSIAVVSCHLSSDSKGKSNMKRRNEDAALIWQSLHLGGDAMGIEFPFLHHHTIVMGDLNYRLSRFHASPKTIVHLVQQAITQKKWPQHLHEHTIPSPSKTMLSPITSQSNQSPVNSSTSEFSRIGPEEYNRKGFQRRIFGAWGLVLDHDELYMCMEDSMAFTGFNEAPISFAPTYRRIRQTSLSTSTDLASIFSLEASNGGGVRVPSYTDRILHHSMPDVEGNLVCTEYRSHEAVDVSDHKPVSCIYQIATKTRKYPLRQLNAMLEESEEDRPWLGYAKMTDVDGVKECILMMNQLRWTSTFKSHASDEFAVKWNDQSQLDDVSICALFPLPLEDIFAEQRKLHQLAATWGTGLAGHGGENRSKHLNHTRISWNIARDNGFVHRCYAQAKRHMHVAIDLRTATNSLGQCALSLDNAFMRINTYIPFEVVLVSGGMKTGLLRGRLMFRVA